VGSRHNIVFLPRFLWDGSLARKVHTDHNTAFWLAQRNDVFYMNPVPLRFLARYPGVIKKFVSRVKEIPFPGGRIVFEYFVLPFDTRWSWDSLGFNQSVALKAIWNAINRYRLRDFILWISDPSQGSLVGELGERLSVYQCSDDPIHACDREDYRVRIEIAERKLLSKVDLVFATSRVLYEERRMVNEKTYLVPNGVDADRFLRAAKERPIEPVDLRDIPNPRIAFVGNLDDRLDWVLLQVLADRNPSYSFVFIGNVSRRASSDVRQAIQDLSRRANVYLVGHKRNDQIPSYFVHFAAGMIPYRRTKYLDAVFPLKMFEYLAGLIPVVTTDLESLREYEGLINIARTPDEFSQMLQLSVRDGLRDRDHIEQFGRENGWDRRVETMEAFIAQELDGRMGQVAPVAGIAATQC